MMGALFLGGAIILYFAAFAYGWTAADRSYDRLLAGSALSIAETLSAAEGRIDVDIPYASLDMLSAAPEDRIFYRVFGPGDETVTGYPDLPPFPGAAKRPSEAAPATARFFDAPYRGEAVRFALLERIIAEPGLSGSVWVQVGQTRRAREALAQELVLRVVAPIALLLLLALGLIWFGIGTALRPLERIGQELAGRTPSDLDPVAAPVPVEAAPLVDAINGFMRRLSANIDTLRAFVGDAAHQMRTPLAALRAQAQVAADDDPEQLRRSLDAIDRNAAKLSRLLNQMLSDATVMHRSDIRRFEAFDLIALIHEAMHDAVPAAARSLVRFQTGLDAAPLEGDPLILSEALKNLIDNALQHGRGMEHGLTIALAADATDYGLTVCDHGPGIAPADRARLFERFARGSSARGGAGLGLAIVRRAVESHGGSIVLSDREGGGLCVRLALPRHPA